MLGILINPKSIVPVTAPQELKSKTDTKSVTMNTYFIFSHPIF